MKKDKKSITKPLTVGIVIVIVATLLVVGILIIPGLSAKAAFSAQLDKLSQSTLNMASVYSPDIAVGTLGQKGKEALIADIEEFRQLLIELARDTDFSLSKKDLNISEFDYRIRFKTTDKGAFSFYLDNGLIYWIDEDSVRHYFVCKNTDAYSSLTQRLSKLLGDDK